MGISRLWGRNEEMVMRYAVAERVVGMQTVREKRMGANFASPLQRETTAREDPARLGSGRERNKGAMILRDWTRAEKEQRC